MREGIAVQDSVDDITEFAKTNKYVILGIIALVVVLEVAQKVLIGIFNLSPLVLIGLGIYFLFFRKKDRD
jgi:Flp pilus assembly protein protease CpaA